MTTAPAKNLQRILVVDDEPSISELISTSLRFVGGLGGGSKKNI